MKKHRTPPHTLIGLFLKRISPWELPSLFYFTDATHRSHPSMRELKAAMVLPIRHYVKTILASIVIGALAYVIIPHHFFVVIPESWKALPIQKVALTVIDIVIFSIAAFALLVMTTAWYYRYKFGRLAKRLQLMDLSSFREIHCNLIMRHMLTLDSQLDETEIAGMLLDFGKKIAELPTKELHNAYDEVTVTLWVMIQKICKEYPPRNLAVDHPLFHPLEVFVSSWHRHAELLVEMDEEMPDMNFYVTYLQIHHATSAYTKASAVRTDTQGNYLKQEVVLHH